MIKYFCNKLLLKHTNKILLNKIIIIFNLLIKLILMRTNNKLIKMK